MTSTSPVIEVPPQTAYELVRNGTGVALLTQAMVKQDLKTGRLIEIVVTDMLRLQRESLLVHRTDDSSLSTAVNEWLRLFREEARHYCLT